MLLPPSFFFFFFNDTATTEIYTLSLHDALPICTPLVSGRPGANSARLVRSTQSAVSIFALGLLCERSEEHTSELQSQSNLVCRLLLEKKKKTQDSSISHHILRACSVHTLC